jgi:hypothetical protein
LYYYIFLIATYRRISGSDLTATKPSAIPAAAMVIAVTYPSVRITFSCSSADPRQRPATSLSLIPEQAARCTAGQPLTAAKDPSCQAVTCIVFAALRDPGQRALIDDDVTDVMLGQRRVAAAQQRLPVQPNGVTAVEIGVPATR